jgi:hypothetical protein
MSFRGVVLVATPVGIRALAASSPTDRGHEPVIRSRSEHYETRFVLAGVTDSSLQRARRCNLFEALNEAMLSLLSCSTKEHAL